MESMDQSRINNKSHWSIAKETQTDLKDLEPTTNICLARRGAVRRGGGGRYEEKKDVVTLESLSKIVRAAPLLPG